MNYIKYDRTDRIQTAERKNKNQSVAFICNTVFKKKIIILNYSIKNQIMRKNLKLSGNVSLLSFIVMLLFVAACEKSDLSPEAKELEINLLESADLFSSALKERDSDHIFEIKDIIRQDAMLQVKVVGGGTSNSFKFIWDGQIQESYPMGIALVLKYDNNNDDFDPNKELVIETDLQKILGDRNNPKDFRFSIINGSKKQNKSLNPDGTVTDK